MNLKEINDTLFSQAKSLRMCDAVHKQWYGKVLSTDDLFSLYYANLDFCIEYRWPDATSVRDMFDVSTLREHGVVANDKWSLLNPTHSIIMGTSHARIRFNGFSVGRVTVMGGSVCEITAKGHSHVTLCVYDNADVRISAEDNARVIILKCSDNCMLKSTGMTTIKECI